MVASILAGFVDEADLARQLGHNPATLRRWRKMLVGPPFVMNGRTVIYNIEKTRAWLVAGGTRSAAKQSHKRR